MFCGAILLPVLLADWTLCGWAARIGCRADCAPDLAAGAAALTGASALAELSPATTRMAAATVLEMRVFMDYLQWARVPSSDNPPGLLDTDLRNDRQMNGNRGGFLQDMRVNGLEFFAQQDMVGPAVGRGRWKGVEAIPSLRLRRQFGVSNETQPLLANETQSRIVAEIQERIVLESMQLTRARARSIEVSEKQRACRAY